MPRSWCNFCEEHHEESTCEVNTSATDKIFGKRPETTIVVLYFTELEDVMIINTRNNPMLQKENMTPLVLHLAQAHLRKMLLNKILKLPTVKEFPPLFPLPNITFSTNWII